jgi:hypothetical protein
MTEQRIIDRDIEFYEGVVEQLTTDIRRCHPSKEISLSMLQAANHRVVQELKALRTLIDNEPIADAALQALMK